MSKAEAAARISRGLTRKLARLGISDVVVTAEEISTWVSEGGFGGVHPGAVAATEPSAGAEGTTGTAMPPLVNSRVSEGKSKGMDSAEDPPAPGQDASGKPQAETPGGERGVSGGAGRVSASKRVWSWWLAHIGGSSDTPMPQNVANALKARLASGFSVAELCSAINRAMEEPSIVNRRVKVKSPMRVIGSDKRVCELLGRPYEPKRETWLTPFDEAFKAQYGAGSLAYGQFSRSAAPLRERFSAEDLLAEFKAYIADTSLTYLNWHKFAEGCGGWRGRIGSGRSRAGRQGMQGALEGVWEG